MQAIGSKCLVVFEARVVEIIGAVDAPQIIVEDHAGARFKVGPDCVLDALTVRAIDPADSLDDQFTGADMGAEMAAAEGFNHSRQIATRGDRVKMRASGLPGFVDEISGGPGGWSYLIRLDDGGYSWQAGDDFDVVA